MLTAHRYHARAEFLADIELIASNCEQYNGSESRFTKNAKDLLQFARTQLEEVINGTKFEIHLMERELLFIVKYYHFTSSPIIVLSLSKTLAKCKSVHVPTPNWMIHGAAMIKTTISHTARVVRVHLKMISSTSKVASVHQHH